MNKNDHTATLQENKESTIVKPQEKKQEKTKKQPRFRVLLWNDDDHSFEYVVTMMQRIFGYSKTRGMIIACGVHSCGKTSVAVLPLEVAELKRDQIRNYGPDSLVTGCVSSMFATIEAIEEE